MRGLGMEANNAIVKIKDVIATLEEFAPLPLQDGYDNAGLQVGLTEAEVSGVLLCLDVTEKILEEAYEQGCNLVVSHHPIMFHPLNRLTDATQVERSISYAVKHDITIYSAHTNLDNAMGGVSFEIARRLGLEAPKFLVDNGNGGGSGVIGHFDLPMAADDFISLVKERFCVECVMSNELLRRPIKSVAICGGAGDFLLPDAIKNNADAFLTGEMHYHRFFGWEQKIQIAVIGHYQSEQYTVSLLADIISARLPQVRLVATGHNTNPILYF